METRIVQRRVERVRYELHRRELALQSIRRFGNFASMTLAGEDLAGFQSGSFDDHIKVFLPGPGGEPVGRDYTPRHFDAGKQELLIEFLLHGDGAASQWAAIAKEGSRITIGGPRGSMIVPMDYEWHVLAGDSSALPAISRRLEELPANARVTVIAQAPLEDERAFESAAKVDLRWVREPGELLGELRALQLPAGEGYVWCAGEASQMAQARGIVLEEKGHPHEAARIAAYWKTGEAGHHG